LKRIKHDAAFITWPQKPWIRSKATCICDYQLLKYPHSK